MKTALEFFEELTKIPRASGNERGVCDYLEAFARERNLKFRRDDTFNAVIFAPATQGAGGETLMLQAHTDIVPVKDEGVAHNFAKDPIRLVKEGDIWHADGTSLGGDNGLGVAAILAILDDPSAVHPDLECVFTAQEEVGLVGATALTVDDLHATRLINLDCGSEGRFCTSCAGGVRVDARYAVSREAAEGNAYTIEISGLKGGHSGGEIISGRANALRVLARALKGLEGSCGARLIDLAGGDKDNVIPSYAKATVQCAQSPNKAVQALRSDLRAEYAEGDPDLSLTCERTQTVEQPLLKKDQDAVLTLLLASPNGIRAMMPGQHDMVETSANLGSARLADGEFRLTASIRSSKEQSKRALEQEFETLCAFAGATVTAQGDYPGWAYRLESPLREAAAKVYKEKSGEDAIFFGIHGGLECGLLAGKMPGLDAIAMGAEAGGAHTTKEWMSVSALERMYTFLKALVAELARDEA